MKKIALALLAMGMFISVPCLAFVGYKGHEGQIPFCQNNKTGILRFAPTKNTGSTQIVDYEPYCNAKTETLIWVNPGMQGPPGP